MTISLDLYAGESIGRLIKRLQLPLGLKRIFFGKPTTTSLKFTGVEAKMDTRTEAGVVLGWLRKRHQENGSPEFVPTVELEKQSHSKKALRE